MEKFLIASADDLGLTAGVNKAIAETFRSGAVTYLNILPSGKAFEDALAILKRLEVREVGAHLALTEVSPVSDRNKVKSLLGRDGNFRKNYGQFFADLFLNKIDQVEVYTELRNQLDLVKSAGLPITCLTSHEHIHMMPGVLKIFIALAKEYSIPAVRSLNGDMMTAFRPLQLYRKLIITLLGPAVKKRIIRAGLYTSDYFMGFVTSGKLDEEILLKMANAVLPGVTELVSHPGYPEPELIAAVPFHANRDAETAALLRSPFARSVADAGIKMITFGEAVKLKERKN